MSTQNDPVHRPAHYANTNIEVANFIADRGLDYFLGNVVKYVSRAGIKNPDTELEDLEKAQAYLGMKIRMVNGEEPISEVERRLRSAVEAEPFCNSCAGPYNGPSGYGQWLADQYGGHDDTCPNRPKNVGFKSQETQPL